MMSDAAIVKAVKNYRFYHTIQLTKTIFTPGWDACKPCVEIALRALRSLDLRGKRVLDIGCRDGLFSFEAEKMGAREVIAIDNELSPAAVEFLIPFFKSRVKMSEMNLLELHPDTFGPFDVVIFPGVLYHLRYPIWSLKLIRDILVDGGQMVIETAVLADDNQQPLLYCPIGDDSPYEPTSCTFFNIRALCDTLHSLGFADFRTRYVVGKSCHTDLRELPAHWHACRTGATENQFLPAWPPPGGKLAVARVAFTCRHDARLAQTPVSRYWDGTHRFHALSNQSGKAA
jgi:SAM-dependent methyltransferase